MDNKFTIALLQLSLNDTPENNRAKCSEWISRAAAKGAQVICLPELYSADIQRVSRQVGRCACGSFLRAPRTRALSQQRVHF